MISIKSILERAKMARTKRVQFGPQYELSSEEVLALVPWDKRDFDIDVVDGKFVAFHRHSNKQIRPRGE